MAVLVAPVEPGLVAAVLVEAHNTRARAVVAVAVAVVFPSRHPRLAVAVVEAPRIMGRSTRFLIAPAQVAGGQAVVAVRAVP